MNLQYKNLTIRDAVAADAEQLVTWWNNGAVMAHAGFPNGLGRIILSMLISWLFEQGFEKIVLDTNLTNKRAQHVYESLGFSKLRINYDSWTDQLGNKQSAVDYELTEDNFIDYRK